MRRSFAIPLHLTLGLSLATALVGAAWPDPKGAYTIEFSEDWRLHHGVGVPLLDDQLMRAVHQPSGGGIVIRDLDKAEVQDIKKKRKLKGADMNALLSPDRLARAMQQAQDPKAVGTTIYVGPADAVDPGVGRWVYLPPPDEDGVQRIWWQSFWQTEDRYHNLIGWVPAEHYPAFRDAMQALEGEIARDYQPPATVLFDAGQRDCGSTVKADRSLAVRDSRRFEDVRTVLRGAWESYSPEETALGLPANTALGLAEQRAMGLLYRLTEQCVHRTAQKVRACSVTEGAVQGSKAEAFHRGVVACLDADEEVVPTMAVAIEPLLGRE